jgi:hypothetical protein
MNVLELLVVFEDGTGQREIFSLEKGTVDTYNFGSNSFMN